MKITGVETLYLRQPQVKGLCDSGQDALIVKVTTDAGITGIGEVDSSPMAVRGAIEGPFSHTVTSGLREIVMGEDPFETEYLWDKMYRANIYAGRRGVGIHAMSGIDMALWDIKGKAFGLPVWKLLGGGFHKKLRCYASSLFGPTPEATHDLARRYRDRGFNAVKFGWDPMGRDAKTDIALVEQGRKGLGDDADLLIDAGLVWDAKTAIQRVRAFEEYDIFWLEEPLRPDDYDGYRKLSEATATRIAAGEEESNRLAHDRGLVVANHGFTTYINVTAALHFLNSIPNALIVEFVAEEETTLREKITKQKLRAVDGYLSIPDSPGLGVDLDEEGLAKYRVA